MYGHPYPHQEQVNCVRGQTAEKDDYAICLRAFPIFVLLAGSCSTRPFKGHHIGESVSEFLVAEPNPQQGISFGFYDRDYVRAEVSASDLLQRVGAAGHETLTPMHNDYGATWDHASQDRLTRDLHVHIHEDQHSTKHLPIGLIVETGASYEERLKQLANPQEFSQFRTAKPRIAPGLRCFWMDPTSQKRDVGHPVFVLARSVLAA